MSEETTSTQAAPSCCCSHSHAAHAPHKQKSLLLGVAIGAVGVFALGALHHGHSEHHGHEGRRHHHMQMEQMQMEQMRRMDERMGGHMGAHARYKMDEMLRQMSDPQREAGEHREESSTSANSDSHEDVIEQGIPSSEG